MPKIHLFVIDPQNDFCLPESEGGALSVPGAKEDMVRLSEFVEKNGDKLDEIHVTLDNHHPIHIAHPIFWKDSDGNQPDPFTNITKNDVLKGVWTPYDDRLRTKSIEYLESLENSGRYPHTIWVPHCLIASPGSCIIDPLRTVLYKWEEKTKCIVNKVTKGSNPFTEHFSAVKAEVQDPKDPFTMLNEPLINLLSEADKILWAGEALNFCLANTAYDTAAEFSIEDVKDKFVFLEDASSPISNPVTDVLTDNFKKWITDNKIETTTTTDFFA